MPRFSENEKPESPFPCCERGYCKESQAEQPKEVRRGLVRCIWGLRGVLHLAHLI